MRAAVVIAAAALAVGVERPARADGELAMRAVYYKEKATRVEQPMIDGRFDAGEGGTVDAHFLIDAITSASPGSGAAAASFTEHRYEAGAGYQHQLADLPLRLGAFGRASTESDYDSGFLGGHAEYDFANKNFTLGATGGAGYDHITNAGAQGPFVEAISEHLTSTLGSLSASQILTKTTIGSITYDVAHYSGYLANPYRMVVTGDGLVGERMPRSRTRHAVAGILRQYVEATETTLIASYRFYVDDWGVLAHTPELRVVQALGDALEVGADVRYYWQSEADFYKPVYPTSNSAVEAYLTDDPKLSRFTGETFGGKVAVAGRAFGLDGMWGDARAELIVEYVVQHNRFGNAGVAHAALTVPFSY
jgi:Protein of unknown function (DUF3570)